MRKKVNGYGELIARKRAKEKKELSNAIATKPVRQKTEKSTTIPQIDYDVMNNKSIKPYDYIDWNSPSTYNIGMRLAEKVSQQTMSLLKMPTGSGKTAVTVFALGELQKQLGRDLPFIVIAPAKSVQGLGWHNTIEAYNQANPKNQLKPITITTPDKLARLLEVAKSCAEVMRSLTKDGIVVLDEVHLFKNPVSKRSKQLQKLSDFKKIGITATPLTNNPVTDMASYLIMGNYYKNKTDFERKAGLTYLKDSYGKYMIYDWEGRISEQRWPYYSKLLGEFKNILYSPNIDVKTLDMPDVVSHVVQLEYNDALNEDLRSLASANRKRMFDSIVDYLLVTMERICQDEMRLKELENIVTKHNQPLIFYQHNFSKDAILQKLAELGYHDVQVISGGTDFSKIDLEVEAPILIQYQAGSAAIELKNSDCSIFYENQYSHISLIQARGRNVRRASGNELVHHYYLISDCALDIEVYARVARGEELTTKTLEKMVEEYI